MTQPPGSGAPPPAQAPFPPPPVVPVRRRRTGLIVALVGAAVLLVALAVTAGLVLRGQNVATAGVGDCLHLDQSEQSFVRRDCGAADADHRVLAVTDGTRACIEVVGTTRTIDVNARVLCVGEKDADPARAVNGAKVGECLTVSGQDAERAPCGSGSRPILKILKNQLRSTGGGADLAFTCQDVDGAEQVYAWTLDSVPPQPVGRYDLIFCLGPVGT